MIAEGKPIIKPSRICLELTNHCNLSCVFCDRENLKQEGMVLNDMSSALFGKILQDIKAEYTRHDKLETLVLVGLGEPTLARNLKQHLETIAGYSHLFRNIELTSNAVPITEQKAEILLDSDINRFTFSVNFSDREKYAAMMGKDNFDAVIRNVRDFLALRAKKGKKVSVRLQLFTEVGTGHNELDILKGYFREYVDDPMVGFHLQPIYNKPVIQDDSRSLNVQKSCEMRHPCGCLYSIVYIDVEGFVYPCTIGNDSYRKNSALNIGNVIDEGLVRIFNGEVANNARSRAESCQLPFPECKECNLWSIMPNLFLYRKRSETWKKSKVYGALIQLKARVSPAIEQLPYPIQNAIREIYSLILKSHNRRVS